VRAPIKKLEPLHTVAETAKILNVSEKTVRRRIDDGLLRAIRLRRGDDRRSPLVDIPN
jgi:excisionase family DNA binding protein